MKHDDMKVYKELPFLHRKSTIALKKYHISNKLLRLKPKLDQDVLEMFIESNRKKMENYMR